jgi:hypothetical protein
MVSTRKKLMPFGAGDYVVDETDPRHAARVSAVWGLPGVYTAKLKWIKTGWTSECATRSLRKITREEAMELA